MRTGFRISSLVPSGLVFDGVSDSEDSVILAVRSEAANALCARQHRAESIAVTSGTWPICHLRAERCASDCSRDASHVRCRIAAGGSSRSGSERTSSRFDGAGRHGWNASSITWGWRSAAGRRQASPSGSCCLSATIPCCGWSAGGRRCLQIHCLLWASMTGRSGETIGTGPSCAI